MCEFVEVCFYIQPTLVYMQVCILVYECTVYIYLFFFFFSPLDSFIYWNTWVFHINFFQLGAYRLKYNDYNAGFVPSLIG